VAGDDERQGQARTRLARRAVVDAARASFLERGYGTTTIELVSSRSQVPQATVYRLFGSKIGILRAVIDESIAGDDEPVPVASRPQVRALADEPDAAKRIAAFAAVAGQLNARVQPLYRILVGAAASDAEAAGLLAELSRQRQEGQRLIARSLARSGALRRGLRERDAADVVHALASPEVYGLLVGDRSWAPSRWERWLTDTLVEQLLGT